jgi:peptidoglycan/LPS O-acetylase OafA/YrhL
MKRIVELDSLRGIAAMIVFINHILIMLPLFLDRLNTAGTAVHTITYTPLHVFWAGTEAVYLFFLLSGFVLAIPFFTTEIRYSAFVVKRIFRLYIPYLVAVTLGITLDLLLSRGGIKGLSSWFNEMWTEPVTARILLGHLLMIGNFNVNVFDSPIWSLVQEMRISLVFPILMFSVVRFNWIVNLLIALFISAVPFKIGHMYHNSQINAYSITLMYAAMFIAGALLAKHRTVITEGYRRMPRILKCGLLCVGIVLFTYKWLLVHVAILHEPIIANWFVTMGAAIFIVTAIGSGTASRVLRFYPIAFLGKVSYSFYLLHAIVLYTVTYLLYSVMPLWIIWVLALLISVGLSGVSYDYIELPSIRYGKRVSSRIKNKSVPVASTPVQ